jgi:peptide deformylase
MLETMRCHKDVGLVGPQIGVLQRIFVSEIPRPKEEDFEPYPQSGKTYILVNPKIIKPSNNVVEGEEGCLSVPGWHGVVERPEWVQLKAQDINGRKIKLRVNDLLAHIFMQEIDHLNGILYIQHIKDPEKLWQDLPEEEEKEGVEKAQITV